MRINRKTSQQMKIKIMKSHGQNNRKLDPLRRFPHSARWRCPVSRCVTRGQQRSWTGQGKEPGHDSGHGERPCSHLCHHCLTRDCFQPDAAALCRLDHPRRFIPTGGDSWRRCRPPRSGRTKSPGSTARGWAGVAPPVGSPWPVKMAVAEVWSHTEQTRHLLGPGASPLPGALSDTWEQRFLPKRPMRQKPL